MHEIKQGKKINSTIVKTTSNVYMKGAELGFHWPVIHIYLTSEHLAYFNHFFCKPDIYTYLILSIVEKCLQVYGKVYAVCKLRVPAICNRNLLLVGGILLRVPEMIFWCFHENLFVLENIMSHPKSCLLPTHRTCWKLCRNVCIPLPHWSGFFFFPVKLP